MSPEVYILLLAILVQAITTIDSRIPSLVKMGQEKKPEAIFSVKPTPLGIIICVTLLY